MANLQYIGARYVPKFYLNPDDSSNDWKSGVLYEALTIVTYNNDSYTSKVTVPASVGNPADNPQYWACTTKYTAALMALQSTVGLIEDFVGDSPLSTIAQDLAGAINEIAPSVKYLDMIMVTPEMFGAYGDNSHDDTAAVQAAIDSGAKYVFFANKYKVKTLAISNPVVLFGLSGNRTEGGLWFAGDETEDLLTITTSQVHIYGLALTGNRSVEQTTWFYGSGARAIAMSGIEDCDITIQNCVINWFREVISTEGRGVTIQNCSVSQIVNLVDVNFKDTDDNAEWFRTGKYQARRYIIQNNKIHYMVYNGYLFVYDTESEISAGVKVPCTGLKIENNYLDVSQRFAHVYADVYGASICKNTVVGPYTSAFQFIRCEKSIFDSNICDNVVWADDVTDTTHACDSLVIATVEMKNTNIIGNNIHTYVSHRFIRSGSGQITRCNISNNISGNIDPTFKFIDSSKCRYCIITGNFYTGIFDSAADWASFNTICEDNVENDYT